jgi:hypothetical protein
VCVWKISTIFIGNISSYSDNTVKFCLIFFWEWVKILISAYRLLGVCKMCVWKISTIFIGTISSYSDNTVKFCLKFFGEWQRSWNCLNWDLILCVFVCNEQVLYIGDISCYYILPPMMISWEYKTMSADFTVPKFNATLVQKPKLCVIILFLRK